MRFSYKMGTFERSELMHMRVVSMFIKPGFVETFRQDSARGLDDLIAEPGVVSTALLQQADARTHFLFIEAYASREAYNEHLKSTCYLDWLRQVSPMLDGQPESLEYVPVYPPEEDWLQETVQSSE